MGTRRFAARAARICVCCAWALWAVGWPVGCTEEAGSGGPVDAQLDTSTEEPSVFAVQVSNSVAESSRFLISLQALHDDNSIASTFASDVSVESDWGDIALEAPLVVASGKGETIAVLNRAGSATLTLRGGGIEQTVSILVVPPPFSRNPDDPVLSPVVISGPNAQNHWTASGIRYPHVSVAPGGDGYMAYFTSPADIAKPDSDDAGAVLGRALASSDGDDFALDPEEPLLAAGDLGLAAIADPHVLAVDGAWHLWLSARETEDGPWLVAYATSADGLAWQRATCLEVRGDPARSWMASGARDPSAVLLDDGRIRLYFAGLPNAGTLGAQIGYVSGSCDAGLSGPVLAFQKGPNQSWEERNATQPFVWRDGSVWKLLYSGQPSTAGAGAIGYATSPDGGSWVRAQDTPVFQRTTGTSSPSSQGVGSASFAVLSSGRAALFFEGRNFLDRASMGRAVGPLP